MSQPDKANHWDNLAEQMGIEPPAEPAAEKQVETSIVETPPPEPEPAPPAVTEPASPEPTKSQNSWASLAEELGVEPAPESVTAVRAEEEAREPIFVDVEVVDETLPIESAAKEAAATLSETIEENIDFGDAEVEVDSKPEADIEAEIKSAPSEEEPATAEEEVKRPARKRRRRRGRKPRGEKTEENDQVETVVEEPEAEPREATESTGEEEPTDGRRRRRRRRRRGGRKSEIEGETEGPAGEEETDELISAPADDETGKADDETGKADDETDETGDETDEPTPNRSTRPSHKNIPTWEESIGVIVQTNMDRRTARPQAAKSGATRGKPRGRGRGRGRKK